MKTQKTPVGIINEDVLAVTDGRDVELDSCRLIGTATLAFSPVNLLKTSRPTSVLKNENNEILKVLLMKKKNRSYELFFILLTSILFILSAIPAHAIYLSNAKILGNHMLLQRDKRTEKQIDLLVGIFYFQKRNFIKKAQPLIDEYVSIYGEVPSNILSTVRELRLKELDELYKKARPGYVVHLHAHVTNYLTGKKNPWKTTPPYGERLIPPASEYEDDLNRVTFETIGLSEITDETADIELSAKVVGDPKSYIQPACLDEPDINYPAIPATITVISMEIFPSQDAVSTPDSQADKPMTLAPRWNEKHELTPASTPSGD